MSWKRTRVRVVVGAVVAVAMLGVGAYAGAQSNSSNEPPPGAEAPRAGASSPTEHGYVPITPCRIVNTQTGPRMAANEVREFRAVQGTASQGGAASCGIPPSAAALEVAIAGVLPRGNGYLRVGRAGEPTPTATFLNYGPPVNLSNAGTVPMRPGTGANLRVQTFVQATHVIIDVLGYYVPDLMAVVDSTGSLVRGNNVDDVERVSTGNYRVYFDRDISGCGYGASIGNPIDGVPVAGQITATPTAEQDQGVYLQSRDSAGNLRDRPFHLTVTC